MMMMTKCFLCNRPVEETPDSWYESDSHAKTHLICEVCRFRSPPRIVCLCGSTKFFDDFAQTNLNLTLQGTIVLSIGCDTHHVDAEYTDEQKYQLDWLHKQKILMSDAVLVLNVDDYIGESTKSEIQYAEAMGKLVVYKYLHRPT